jgi:hypothetical protein
MAASDHLHPQQLSMFMTAQELHDTHSLDVQQTPESRFGGHWKSMDAMWKTKRKENKADGLDKHVAEHGVHNPVELASGRDVTGEVIAHGHHRIQAAYDANPQSLLPVVHHSLEQHGRWNSDDRPVPGWEDTNRFPSYP